MPALQECSKCTTKRLPAPPFCSKHAEHVAEGKYLCLPCLQLLQRDFLSKGRKVIADAEGNPLCYFPTKPMHRFVWPVAVGEASTLSAASAASPAPATALISLSLPVPSAVAKEAVARKKGDAKSEQASDDSLAKRSKPSSTSASDLDPQLEDIRQARRLAEEALEMAKRTEEAYKKTIRDQKVGVVHLSSIKIKALLSPGNR